jgi:23S rRNA (adenine2503-C2)-methyltransferase
MQDIKDLNLEELQNKLGLWKEKAFHARQIFSWIYGKGITDFSQMSNLALGLRRKLSEGFSLRSLEVIEILTSEDQTQKFLFKTADANFVEAVSIPVQDRTTVCLSTQAGCRFNCKFCASGKSGFKRNLSCAEILEQLIHIKNMSLRRGFTHVVFMGTGEPLDNYDNLIKSIRIINSPSGFNIGARRITISTCGIIPQIKKLAREGLQVELSVSLHAATDKKRSEIMPVNIKYPLDELIKACRWYFSETGRQVTFEYCLIKGYNSDLQSARNLSKILQGFDCKVNLIPVNLHNEFKVEPPGKLEVLFFKDHLIKEGVITTLRRSRGQDISAACGQLRLRYEKN